MHRPSLLYLVWRSAPLFFSHSTVFPVLPTSLLSINRQPTRYLDSRALPGGFRGIPPWKSFRKEHSTGGPRRVNPPGIVMKREHSTGNPGGLSPWQSLGKENSTGGPGGIPLAVVVEKAFYRGG